MQDWGLVDATGTNAEFHYPSGLAPVGSTLFVGDWDNNAIRAVATTGVPTVLTLAGDFNPAPGSANGVGAAATFSYPAGMAASATSLYVADFNNNELRAISLPGGVVTTLAGSVDAGHANGIGSAARFYGPAGVALSPSGTAYVADCGNNQVRSVAVATGAVSVLTGGGSPADASYPTYGYANGGTSDAVMYFVAPRGGRTLR